MPTVTVTLGSGLGNRFFKVAAMLGYAERYGHTPVFTRSLSQDEPSHPGPYGVLDFFPDIPVVDETEPFATTIKESARDALTYRAFSPLEGPVVLDGYFQSERYFPTSPLPLPRLLSGGARRPDTYFFHVRRGDYMSHWNIHHNVPLQNYWQRCLFLLPIHAGTRFLVCSDDLAWCKAELPSLLRRYMKADQWEFSEATTDAETLSEMIGCSAGGICANSTFSWWAAYWILNADKRVCMPATWGYPPMPLAVDVWPSWATKVAV